MLTKTTIALAFILATATGSLAATKKQITHSALSSYAMSAGNSWEQLRDRNVGPSWGE